MRKRFLLVLLAPLTEPMSRMMYAHLKDAGIPKEETSLVYLLQGEMPEGKDDKPTAAQLARTRGAFRLEMEDTAMASVLIPVGPESFRAVTGLRWPIDEARGYVILPEDCKPTIESRQVEAGVFKSGPRKGQPKLIRQRYPAPPPLPQGITAIVPTISFEQYVKQKRRAVTAVMAALSTAAEVAAGTVQLVGEGLQYHDHLEGPTQWPVNEPVAVDIEAPKGSTVIERFSVSWADQTYTLPWSLENAAWLNEVLAHAAPVIAHNIQYDEPMLRANGIHVPEPWFDTMIAARLIEPDLPMGLGKVIPVYMAARPWKFLSTERGYNDPEYSARDAFMEKALFEGEWRTLEEWGMLELFEHKIMPSVKALSDMKERGLRVDPVAAEAWCAKLRDRLRELMAWWVVNVPGVAPSKNREVTNLLYKTWRLPVQRSKHDGWTSDELALRTLADIEPKYREPIEKLLEIRGVSKLLSTYGKAVLGNHYVHPSYLPHGKDERKGDQEKRKGLPGTGRLASSDPNIQNQPDESRDMYIPDHEDWIFVGGDMSQAELRVMAAKSGDLELLRALEGDVHARTMELIPGTSRTLAKNGIYGTSYGAGPGRLVDTMRAEGVYTTKTAMKDFQDSLAAAYPRWWAYLQSVSLEGQSQGYLRNSFGRVRRFTAPEKDVPAMKNFPAQSDVGDIGWSTYRQLWEEAQNIGGRLSILVHDEVVTQVPRDRVRDASDMLHDVMEQEFNEIAPGFRIPIKVKVGARWGDSMVPEEQWSA